MVGQTIGFNNIEWIIVVHNCKPGYFEQVSERIAKYENVKLFELNNDARTASSPRNYALDYVTSPYLVFLDSDDYLSYDCLEKAYKTIVETKVQIVGFRRAFIASNEGLFPMVDNVLWDSSKDLIVAEKDNWDEDVVFHREFLFITSHIFDFSLIKDNNIRFDESIILGEDMFFMLKLIPNLRRVAFLPQLIGYVYYQHAESTIQKKTKTDAQLLSFANGFRKVFDFDKTHGTNSLASYECLRMLTGYILNSHDVKVETRIQIKEILEEVIKETNKYEKDEHYRKLIEDVILNPEDPWNGKYVISVLNGQNELLKIIKENETCDFGKHYNFAEIKDLATYQKNVPLQTYKEYAPMVALYNEVGVENIICSSNISRFFINSNNQLIPNSSRHSKYYEDAFASTLRNKHNFLIARCKETAMKSNNGAMVRDLQSVLVRDYFYYYLDKMLKEDVKFSSEKNVYFVKDDGIDYYSLIIDALLDKEINQIVGLNTKEILSCFDYMKYNWNNLLNDLSKKDENRYKELLDLNINFNEPVAKKLWPKLEKVIGFGAGELYESCKEMKKYIGDVPHNHGYYYTEEAILGKAAEDNSDLFICNMANSVYELLPIDKNLSNDKTLLITEAEINKTYQLVITNHNGLYRYVTDHFISIKEKIGNEIKYIVY